MRWLSCSVGMSRTSNAPRLSTRESAASWAASSFRAGFLAPTSGSSVVKHGVEMVELDTGVVGGEAPVDGADGSVALGHPGGDLLLQGVAIRQTSVEALAGQDAQFDLSEPMLLHVL